MKIQLRGFLIKVTISNTVGYGLDGMGSILGVGGGGYFSSLLSFQTGPGVHSASYKISTGGCPEGKGGRALD